jgi:D-alanine-D-alanine ligase
MTPSTATPWVNGRSAPIAPQALGKVAVLMGGVSAERDISLRSGQAVLTTLQNEGVNAHAFDTGQRSLYELKNEGFDRCFIALHGRFGEDGTVQGALEILGIPYTGSGVMASSLAIDKAMTKGLWQAAGIPSPASQIAQSAEAVETALAQLGAPLIVKPVLEGSSIGLSQVKHVQDCAAAYALAAGPEGRVLCEQYIQGPEYTCALLGSGPQAKALPMVRIEAAEGGYNYQNKYFSQSTRYHIPCGLTTAQEEFIQTLCLKAYHTLGCRGWGRADVMVDESTGKPYLLEMNTVPGMTEKSLFPMAAQAAGITYPQLCLQLLANARLDHAPTLKPN